MHYSEFAGNSNRLAASHASRVEPVQNGDPAVYSLFFFRFFASFASFLFSLLFSLLLGQLTCTSSGRILRQQFVSSPSCHFVLAFFSSFFFPFYLLFFLLLLFFAFPHNTKIQYKLLRTIQHPARMYHIMHHASISLISHPQTVILVSIACVNSSSWMFRLFYARRCSNNKHNTQTLHRCRIPPSLCPRTSDMRLKRRHHAVM